MNQNDILRVLESVEFGQDAAENELDLPEVYVTDSESYRRLLADEVDVLIGGKGSGKSAMYRMITETIIFPELHVIPAVNPTGSPVFRKLFRTDASEARHISVWTAYTVALVANRVVDEFDGIVGSSYLVSEIKEALIELNLRRGPERRKSLIDRIREARAIAVGAKIAGVGADLKFDLPVEAGGTETSVVLSTADFSQLLAQCVEVLEIHGQRLWVAFDRLDECFERNSLAEERALRGLLRTVLNLHQQIGYSGTIRLKVFLRSDLMARMTRKETFTNSTHLRKDVLRWNTNGIAHIISKRVARSDLFHLHYLEESAEDPIVATWAALVPMLRVQYRTRYPSAHELSRRTADGSNEFSPRNLISLLRFAIGRARDNQRRALEVDRASRSKAPLIQDGELMSAQGDVSRQRLRDTVLNEFPGVSQYVERMAGGANTYASLADLRRAIALDVSDENEVVEKLLLSGVLAYTGGRYIVPTLYRAALRAGGPGQMTSHN